MKKKSSVRHLNDDSYSGVIASTIVSAAIVISFNMLLYTVIRPVFIEKPVVSDRATAEFFTDDDATFSSGENFYEAVSGINDPDVKFGEYKIDAVYYPAEPNDEVFPTTESTLCISVKTRKSYVPENAVPCDKPLQLVLETYNGDIDLQPSDTYANTYENEMVVWNYEYTLKPEIKIKGVTASIDTDLGTQTDKFDFDDIVYKIET